MNLVQTAKTLSTADGVAYNTLQRAAAVLRRAEKLPHRLCHLIKALPVLPRTYIIKRLER